MISLLEILFYEQTDEYTVSTQTEYTQSQNFVAKTTDERNNETVYSYDENKGTLQSVTNANGALQYSFLYDKFGRTTANRLGNGNAWRTLSELEYNRAGLLSKQT